MSKADSKLNSLEKQQKSNQPKTSPFIVHWTEYNENEEKIPLEERVKAAALKSGQRETWIEWGANDNIYSYTYDPKLNRGWFS